MPQSCKLTPIPRMKQSEQVFLRELETFVLMCEFVRAIHKKMNLGMYYVAQQTDKQYSSAIFSSSYNTK